MVQFLSLRIVDICVRFTPARFCFFGPPYKNQHNFFAHGGFWCLKNSTSSGTKLVFLWILSMLAPSSTRLIMIESALLFTICKFIKSCLNSSDKWVKLFKNRSSKTCARQSLKNASADHVTSNFWKAVFHKLYLVHSSIPWPK